MDWKAKYIKYKNKYLELKKSLEQKGGVSGEAIGVGMGATEEVEEVEEVAVEPSPNPLKDKLGPDVYREVFSFISTRTTPGVRFINREHRESMPIPRITLNEQRYNQILRTYTPVSRLNVVELNIIFPITNEQMRELFTRTTTNLKSLILGKDTMEFSNFNSQIQPGVLPNSITHLKFGYDFNKPILPNSLPTSLTHLKFDSSFNQEIIPGSLPESLKYLTFDYGFRNRDRPFALGSLPAELEFLYIGQHFNEPIIPGSLPENLKILVLGQRFNHPLGEGILPVRLEKLVLSNNYSQPLESIVFPPGLKELSMPSELNRAITPGLLPPTLTKLYFSGNYNNGGEPVAPGAFPNSIINLVFEHLCRFNQKLDSTNLPTGLRGLWLGSNFKNGGNPLRPGDLPRTLKTIKFGNYWNNEGQPIEPGVFPEGIENMEISYNMVPGTIPSTIKYLSLGNANQLVTPGLLPEGLIVLKLGSFMYHQPIAVENLPESLRELKISRSYEGDLSRIPAKISIQRF